MQYLETVWNRLKAVFAPYSVRFAAFVSILSGLIVDNKGFLLSFITVIPTDPFTRTIFSVGVAAAVFVLPTVLRFWPQPKLEEKTNGK